jgi:hypothetical protein
MGMKSTVLHPDILDRIFSYIEENKISKAKFGRLAMNDPSFVYNIEAGRELRMKTQARVRQFLSEPISQRGDAA